MLQLGDNNLNLKGCEMCVGIHILNKVSFLNVGSILKYRLHQKE